MDLLIIVAIISAVGALFVSVLTHIRYSSCWGMKIFTKKPDSGTSTPTTPLLRPTN